MSPLNFGQPTPGAYGRCRKHGRDLVRRPRADLAEQIATERAAADAMQYLDPLSRGFGRALALPRQSSRRRGDCPQCITETATAAVAYLDA